MKFGIVGTGAVGGYFGGHLSKAGNDVLFLARGNHYEQMKKEGLKIESEKGDFVVQKSFTNDYQSFSDVDYVFICVKSIHTKEVAEALLPIIKPEAIILTLQNGVDNEEILVQYFGQERVLSVSTFIQASIAAPGVIKQSGSNPRLILGVLDQQAFHHVEKLVNLFTDAGVNAKISHEIVKIKWQKLLWNVAFNPLSAATETKVGEIMANEDLLKISQSMCQEAMTVADKLGISIENKIYEGIYQNSNIAGQHNTSMLQDKLNKKPMEIESICGYVVRKGKEVNSPTPVLETMYQLLKFIQSKYM
ncbi:ketopantoate reductase family protein [Bacillus massiliigorillae]|uniref:ketopantoate reductase family protein n=1 Tax=Bacillus massiliigorillae TaxID=1243664 RepID=UPI0003A29AF1|nr:2-dehydropantoate 2-reductase [Bacillus massiliigorillae]